MLVMRTKLLLCPYPTLYESWLRKNRKGSSSTRGRHLHHPNWGTGHRALGEEKGETGCHTPAATWPGWPLRAALPCPQQDDSDDGQGFVSPDQICLEVTSKGTLGKSGEHGLITEQTEVGACGRERQVERWGRTGRWQTAEGGQGLGKAHEVSRLSPGCT